MRLATLLLIGMLAPWAVSVAGAEGIRYIHQPLGDGRDPHFDFQNHTTQTAFVGEGGSITIPREFGSSVWAYKHGLDLTPVTIGGGAGVTVTELGRVNGVKSNVFTETAVPTVSARTGGIGYTVIPSRELPVGTRRTVELRYPAGDKSTFVVVFGCHATGSETKAKLTSAAIADGTLAAGETTQLTIEADMPPACGGQTLAVNAPACFKIVNPINGQLSSSLSLTFEETDSATQSFSVKADATCSQPNHEREVSATLSGVALAQRPTVTWVQPVILPTQQPIVPRQLPEPVLKPAQKKPVQKKMP